MKLIRAHPTPIMAAKIVDIIREEFVMAR